MKFKIKNSMLKSQFKAIKLNKITIKLNRNYITITYKKYSIQLNKKKQMEKFYLFRKDYLIQE